MTDRKKEGHGKRPPRVSADEQEKRKPLPPHVLLAGRAPLPVKPERLIKATPLDAKGEAMSSDSKWPTVPVSAVWVRTEGDHVRVDVEVDGKFHRTHSIPRNTTEEEVSDCAHIGNWPDLRR